jgi:hypothetical protein
MTALPWRLWPLCALALLAACPPRAVRPDPQPARVNIPEGCAENLTGLYAHADDPSWQYEAVDDGGTLALALRRTAPDGGYWDRSQEISIELSRGPSGFWGRAAAVAPGGCPVEFPTRLTGCADGGLQLESSAGVSIDEGCASPTGPPPPMREHHLVPLARPAP